MYNLIRNSTLTGLYVYGSYMLLGDVTDSIIAGLVISGGSILFETLLGLNTHQNSFAKLREKTKHNLDSFDDDGAHLPSLYNFLKNKAGAKLIDKDIYLGDNRNVFERPYRFINDTKYIVKRVIAEIEYLDEIPSEKITAHKTWLFTNDRKDSKRQERYEFYIQNMKPSSLRDSLVEIYRNLYPKSNLKITTSEEIKRIEEKKERLKNIPDHLNVDVFSNVNLK